MAGTAITVWLLIGGIRDMRTLIRDLKSESFNAAEDGFVGKV